MQFQKYQCRSTSAVLAVKARGAGWYILGGAFRRMPFLSSPEAPKVLTVLISTVRLTVEITLVFFLPNRIRAKARSWTGYRR